MTRKEAKNELRPIRQMGSKIKFIELEITDNDFNVQTETYYKKILFTENFCLMAEGDYYGMFIDGNIGLTYSEMGLSSAAVIELRDNALPHALSSLPAPKDIMKPTQADKDAPWKDDVWKEFSRERNVGRAYSFNLFGEFASGE